MKPIFVLALLFLFSCQNSADEKRMQEYMEASSTADEEYTQQMDEFKNEFDKLMAETDSLMQALQKDFSPYDGVERKSNSAALNFELQTWEESFNFLFPIEATFDKIEKSDHDSYSVRELVDGVIYEITIEDYAELGADKIDANFTSYIHDQYIYHFEGDRKDDYELKTKDGVYGFASCYSYDVDGTTFLTDLVSYGFTDKMIRVAVTAKAEFENAKRVQEFVDGIELL